MEQYIQKKTIKINERVKQKNKTNEKDIDESKDMTRNTHQQQGYHSYFLLQLYENKLNMIWVFGVRLDTNNFNQQYEFHHEPHD